MGVKGRQELEVKYYHKNKISADTLWDVINLIEGSGIQEEVGLIETVHYVVAKLNNKLFGCVLYGEQSFSDRTVPRFFHIIVAPEFRRTREVIILCRKSELMVLEKTGSPYLVAYILDDVPTREMGMTYALKFGYKKYLKTNEGEILVKYRR